MFEQRFLARVDLNARGQTLVLVGVMLLVLLGVGAMAIDIGGMLWSRGTQQNAADAAALAGVRELTGDPTPAQQTAAKAVATQYVDDNGFKIGANGVTAVETNVYSDFVNGMPALEVIIRRDVPPYLRWAVGAVGNINVPARAVAVASSRMECGVWPWAMVTANPIFDTNGLPPFGQAVTFKVEAGETISPGSFGIIRLNYDDKGNTPYYNNIVNRGCVTNPDTVYSEGGNKVNPTRDGVKEVIRRAVGDPSQWPSRTGTGPLWTEVSGWGSPNGKDPGWVPDNAYWREPLEPWGLGNPIAVADQYKCSGTWSTTADHDVKVQVGTCPRVGLIPVATSFPGGSGKDMPVVKWLAFYLLGGSDDGGEGHMSIYGAFLREVDPPKSPPTYGKPTDPKLTAYVLFN